MLFLVDEKVKYVRNNELLNTRSDVPDEDTDLLVVPDEDSPLTSIAETVKRRTDLDKGNSNVLSESSSSIEGQLKVYNDGSTSNDQWTGITKGEPATEKVADEKAVEGALMGVVSVPRKPADEKMPEEEKQEENTSIEKATEEQPTNGFARNRFDSTVGQNYATDVSKHLSELLKNGSTNLAVAGGQMDVKGPTMESSSANQPKEQLPTKPPGQPAMPSPNLSKQTETQPLDNSAPSPQVLESNINPFDTLFGQENSLESSEQASSPVIDQPKVSNSEQEQNSPMNSPVSPNQLSASKDAESMNTPTVSGSAAGEVAIGNAALTNGQSDFSSEPSSQISDQQQVKVSNNPENEQETLVTPAPKLPTTQSPTPQSPTSQSLTSQSPTSQSPTSQSLTPQTPQPPLSPSTQKPPVDIDDLFGKHIVEKTDEKKQDEEGSGNKNSTIMLGQTGNETVYNSLTSSKNNTAPSSLKYITPEKSFVGNELQNKQGLGAPYAPQATYIDESLNLYEGRNAGIQLSEQPASVRHLTSTKPIQNGDEYSLKQTKQQAISKGIPDASYANDTALDSNALHLQNRVVDDTNERSVEREGLALDSALNSSEVASNRVDNQQASQYNESSSSEETDPATLQSSKSSFYKTEYTKVAYSAGALLSSLKPDTLNSSDMNVLGNETNQIDNNNQSLAGSISTEGLQEQNGTNSSILRSVSSNDTLSLTAQNKTYPENSMQLQASNEYNLWKNETKEENIPSSLKSINATEFNNNSIYSFQNGKNDEAPFQSVYFEKGLSKGPSQVFNASSGSTSENSIPATSNYSSSSLHDNNGTFNVYNYSSTSLQHTHSSRYVDYTRSNYTSSGNFTQHDVSGSNCSSLYCNQSSSVAVTPSSNFAQPQFYNFSTISKEQMQAIQNAAVSKELSFSSNISIDAPSYISQTKPLASNSKNNDTISNNETSYVVDFKPALYNNTHVLSNIVSANDSSYTFSNGFSGPSRNNTRPKFYDYDNITLNQMKEIQAAAVLTEASPDRNVSTMNETSFSTFFPYVVNATRIPLNSSMVSNASLSQYLSQDPRINASLSYSVLASKGRPQVSDFNTTPANSQFNQSLNSYVYNMSGFATRNNGSVSNYGQLYEIVYNYSQPFSSSKSSYLEQNVARQSAEENITYLAKPAQILSTYNYTQPLNQSDPSNGQSSRGNNYWSSQSVPSNGQSSMDNNYWSRNSANSDIFATESNYSQQSNAATPDNYPSIPYVSEVLNVPNYNSNVSINSTRLLYAGQGIQANGNTDSANTSSKINSKAGILNSTNLNDLFPTPSAAAGTAATFMPLVNYKMEKVHENNSVKHAKNYTSGANKETYAQPLNGAQAKVFGRLVVGHFRQQDIKIAVEQLIVQKPEGPATTTAPLPQSPILSAIDQLSNGTLGQVDLGQSHVASGDSQLSSPYRQNSMGSPSIPTLSASISYSKVKEGARKNESDNTLSQDKLPFRNEEPIITSQLVNPADSSKSKAAVKKPSLTAIISGGKKRPNSDCK